MTASCDIVVADAGASTTWFVDDGKLIDVNPQNGVKHLIREGSPLRNPCGIDVDHTGALLVADTGANAVFRAEPTGRIAELAHVTGVGDVTTLADGAAIATMRASNSAAGFKPGVRVDVATGATTPVVGIESPDRVAASPDGGALFSDDDSAQVAHLGVTGSVDVVFTNPSSTPVAALALEPSGAVVFADAYDVFRWDGGASYTQLPLSHVVEMAVVPGATSHHR